MIVLFYAGILGQLPDECKAANHRVIMGEWKRSAAYESSLADYPYCDSGAAVGW